MLESSSQKLAGGDPNIGESNSKLRQLSISSIANKPKSHRSAEAKENDSSMSENVKCSEKAMDDQSQISEQEAQSENKQQKAKKQKEIEEELKEDLQENKS